MRENLNSSVQIQQAQWFIRCNSIDIVKMNTIERIQELQWNRNSIQKTPISIIIIIIIITIICSLVSDVRAPIDSRYAL